MAAQVELSLHVVVVDDEEMFEDLYSGSLLRSGHSARFFSSAKAALSYCRDNPVDVVITDREMPGFSGTEFSRAVRELGLTTPIGMSSCGIADIPPSEKASILEHADVIAEKLDVLMNLGIFVQRLHLLGQARQNSGHTNCVFLSSSSKL